MKDTKIYRILLVFALIYIPIMGASLVSKVIDTFETMVLLSLTNISIIFLAIWIEIKKIAERENWLIADIDLALIKNLKQ